MALNNNFYGSYSSNQVFFDELVNAFQNIGINISNDGVIVMANGDDAHIVGALYMSAKKYKRLASIIIKAAEMIKAERAKSN